MGLQVLALHRCELSCMRSLRKRIPPGSAWEGSCCFLVVEAGSRIFFTRTRSPDLRNVVNSRTSFLLSHERVLRKSMYSMFWQSVWKVKELTTSGGVIFICGSTDMGNAVLDVLELAGLDTKEMRKKKTLIPELWG